MCEVADGSDVVERVVLAKHDPGRVVAPILEALEAVEEQRLTRSGSYVSDDSAHPETPSPTVAWPKLAPLKRTKARSLRPPALEVD
jgi:hypothetical protein